MIPLNHLVNILSNAQQTADIAINSPHENKAFVGTLLLIAMITAVIDKVIKKHNSRKTSYNVRDLANLQNQLKKHFVSMDENTNELLTDFAKQVNSVESKYAMQTIENFITKQDNNGIKIIRDNINSIKTTSYITKYLKYQLNRQEYYNNERNNYKNNTK